MSEPTRFDPKYIDGKELGREWAREDMAKAISNVLVHDGPDWITEVASLNERLHKHEQDGMEYEKLISHLAERLNNLENKSQFRFAEGYHKGREAMLRTNQSGCCCIVNDSDEIVSVCGAHEQWGDNLLKKLKTIENQFLEILSHGCCIPACSKHRGAIEGTG